MIFVEVRSQFLHATKRAHSGHRRCKNDWIMHTGFEKFYLTLAESLGPLKKGTFRFLQPWPRTSVSTKAWIWQSQVCGVPSTDRYWTNGFQAMIFFTQRVLFFLCSSLRWKNDFWTVVLGRLQAGQVRPARQWLPFLSRWLRECEGAANAQENLQCVMPAVCVKVRCLMEVLQLTDKVFPQKDVWALHKEEFALPGLAAKWVDSFQIRCTAQNNPFSKQKVWTQAIAVDLTKFQFPSAYDVFVWPILRSLRKTFWVAFFSDTRSSNSNFGSALLWP